MGGQEDEDGAGERGAEGTRSQDRREAALLKQQTTRKETGPAPDRPAQCVPKRFPLISVQRRQGRDSKRLAWGWMEEGTCACWLSAERHILAPWSPQIIRANSKPGDMKG